MRVRVCVIGTCVYVCVCVCVIGTCLYVCVRVWIWMYVSRACCRSHNSSPHISLSACRCMCNQADKANTYCLQCGFVCHTRTCYCHHTCIRKDSLNTGCLRCISWGHTCTFDHRHKCAQADNHGIHYRAQTVSSYRRTSGGRCSNGQRDNADICSLRCSVCRHI